MSMPILLFAAGLGTRMAPLTDDMPKPLITVAGTALIDHALDIARAADAGPIVVNLHYRADMLRAHLAGTDIAFSDESDLLRDTGGGLRHALPLLGQGPVVTMNTDAVWRGPNPVSALLAAWRDEMSALLLLVPPERAIGHHGAGDFTCAPDGRLTRAKGAIYTGLQIIKPGALHGFDEPVFSMNRVWDRLEAHGTLYGMIYEGQWCDVGQPSSIALAEEMLNV